MPPAPVLMSWQPTARTGDESGNVLQELEQRRAIAGKTVKPGPPKGGVVSGLCS